MRELHEEQAHNESRSSHAFEREIRLIGNEPRPGQAQPGELESELDALGAAAQGGGEEERNALWSRVRPSLERLALVCGVPFDDTPDVVQETLLFADRSLARFDPERGSFRSWVGALLATRARNHLRARARRHRLKRAFGLSAGAGTPRDERPAHEARLLLERLVSHLSSRQREVVALYEIAGLSAEECARALGMTAAGVRSSARDARRKLAEQLETES